MLCCGHSFHLPHCLDMEVVLLDGNLSLSQDEVNQGALLTDLQAMPGASARLPLRRSHMQLWRERSTLTLE